MELDPGSGLNLESDPSSHLLLPIEEGGISVFQNIEKLSNMTDDQNFKILENENINENKDENYGLDVFDNDKKINEDLDCKMFGKFEEVMLKVRNIHEYDCKSDLIFKSHFFYWLLLSIYGHISSIFIRISSLLFLHRSFSVFYFF